MSQKTKKTVSPNIVEGEPVSLFAKSIISQVTYTLEGENPVGYQTSAIFYFDADGLLVATSVPATVNIPVPPEIAVTMHST